MAQVEGTVLIRAPLEAAYALAKRVEDFPRFMSDLERLTVLERRDGVPVLTEWVGIVEGRIERYPTKCHSEGDMKPKGVIKAIRRRFKLTEDDGVTDKDFYGRA